MVLGLYMRWIDDDVVMTKVDAVIIRAAEEQNLVTLMHGVRRPSDSQTLAKFVVMYPRHQRTSTDMPKPLMSHMEVQ